MKTLLVALVLLLTLPPGLFAHKPEKKAIAIRAETAPRIDGRLEDEAWQNAPTIIDFTQFVPTYNVAPSHPTEVRIVYTDEAIYIAARMFDEAPDSILHQLGNRDDDDLNCDQFGIIFDTYDNELDGFIFIVSASGVQGDQRMLDATYNAVWDSKVRIDEKGWTAELKIPYSALRFPKTPIQNWGMQLVREVRRNRETDQWALEEKGVPNPQKYWGVLEGVKDIVPPLRLSVTPYLSSTISSSPSEGASKNDISSSISGGMDLKYGVNESFTIDLTLLPDFSQVQSDDQIKNLSAFETIYDEQRPFFKEAFDLFSKGNLFYTRRIGRIPLNYYQASDQLKEGDILKDNPVAATMINATKFSGRTRKGLAIGLFNAVTANTYALISDSSGKTRQYLTDPRSNYNIVVFDQALKNNSSFYVINTNVTRDKGYNNANVTGTGFSLFNKKNTYTLGASGALSQIFGKDSTHAITNKTNGLKYNFNGGKSKGNFQAYYSQTLIDDHFSANDMGITLRNNEFDNELSLQLLQFEPKNGFRESNFTLNYQDYWQYTSGMTLKKQLILNIYGNNMHYLSMFGGTQFDLEQAYDFYEPRKEGLYYLKPLYTALFGGISSDYRKAFALDCQFTYVYAKQDAFDLYEILLSPRVRVNDKLFFTYKAYLNKYTNDKGFATMDEDGNPVFGRRDVTVIENSLDMRYLFKNNLSLNVKVRHYYSSGIYDHYYSLNTNGTLSENPNFTGNNDFNFNAFNVDLVFNWEFAPGSQLNLIWKNAIKEELNYSVPDYIDNLHHTFNSPQSNIFTVKMLYYLDYQYLKRGKKQRADNTKS
ncbi:MAG: DUF5916 domain-containing protein [Bacteroidota bacterium]